MPNDTGYALYQAILEDPIDDAPRLIYADWLDERGEEWDTRYAEVIRLEVWLSRADKRRAAGDWSPANESEYDRRLERLAGLWWNHSYKWFRDTHRDDVDRGFIRTLHTSRMTFLDREAALFTRHPITVVEFDDVWYERDEKGFAVVVSPHWRQDEPYYALAAWPLELFPGKDGRTFRFETTAEADAVLSDAAVAYGRRLVGLPELRLPHQL